MLSVRDAFILCGETMFGFNFTTTLAGEIGQSARSVRRYKAGERDIRPETAAKVARLCRARAAALTIAAAHLEDAIKAEAGSKESAG